MVLGRDFNFAGRFVQDRLIRSSVTESKLECSPAAGKSQQLKAQTDPKDRFPAEETLDRTNRVVEWFGIAWSVGQEDTVRVEFEDFFGSRLAGHHGDAAAGVGQPAGNPIFILPMMIF